MKQRYWKWSPLIVGMMMTAHAVRPEETGKTRSSYAPVDIHESFSKIMIRMAAAKPEVMKRHMALLEQRYDLTDRPAKEATMSKGKRLQQGVRVKLPSGVTWNELARLTPEQIRDRDLFPAGFQPLPHPNHPEGGMLFPKFEIDEMKKQTGRDLARLDLDFDFPEFPPPCI